MSAIDADFCPNCGDAVESAERIAAPDGFFSDVCQGRYSRDEPDSCLTVEGQTVRVFVHEEDAA